MSHFSVLVITDNEPTDSVLSEVMQPFHEFECTGTDDKYVQDIDITEKVLEEYKSRTVMQYRDQDGVLHDPYQDKYYRDPTDEEKETIGQIAGTGCGGGLSWSSKDWDDSQGYRTKIHFVPEGMEEVEVEQAEVRSFRDFVREWHEYKEVLATQSIDREEDHKYGFTEIDKNGNVVRVVKRTNPNDKWDYWMVGGRYAGKLQAKNATAAVAAPLSWEWSHEAIDDLPDGVDICQIENLDVDAMKRQAVRNRQKWADDCCKKAGVGMDVLNIAVAQQNPSHMQWSELESKPRGSDYHQWLRDNAFIELAKVAAKNWELPEPAEGQTVEEWIEAAPYLTSFAVLKDGQWYERGKMGWWGCVSDEDGEWDSKFVELLNSLRSDQWIAVLDCHI